MTKVTRQLVGSIDLQDLAALCEFLGHEYLPYPLMQTRPAHSAARSRHDADASSSFADRFEHGDLKVFREWMNAYAKADIWIESRILYNPADTPHARILAYRAGEAGFFAWQRPGEDIVDVYRVSAYELGVAIADSVGLTGPGTYSRIIVPKYVDYFRAPANESMGDDYNFSILRPVAVRPRATGTVVKNADVAAVATVQSHCNPAHAWGVDWTKKFLVWVAVRNDGEYIYTPDFSRATPLTTQILSDRIDQIIAEDVAALRQRRRRA
jgi:hypothetical protein